MSFRGYIISVWDKMNKEYNYLLKSEKYQYLQIVDYHNLIWYNQNWREKLGSIKLPIKMVATSIWKGMMLMLISVEILKKGVENVCVRSYSTNDRFCDFCNCTFNFGCSYCYLYDEKITIFKLWQVKMVIS